MKARTFLPGVEVDGCWYADEDGALSRAAKAADYAAGEHGAGLVPIPMNALYLASLEADVMRDRLDERAVHQAARDAAEWGDTQGACVELGATVERAALALGLVSVPTTHAQTRKSRRVALSPSDPFRVQAERAAVAELGNAFVAGGDVARMAKLRRSVGFAARGHGAARQGHRPDEVRMLTLTYAKPHAWRANHIRSLMNRVRDWHAEQGVKCRYVWVAEIQDGKRRDDGAGRGAVHYHVVLWVPQGTAHMPKADKCGWWPHGSSKTEAARHAVGYVMHYLKKSNSKTFGEFPNGCRIYSVGGLDHSLRRARRWLGLPSFVQGNSSIFDDWRRVVGGGWCSPDGELIPSEFRQVMVGGVRCLQRLHTHVRVIEASGPFSWLTDQACALQLPH